MGAVLFPEDSSELGCEVIGAMIIIGKPDTTDTELLVDLLEGNYMGVLAGDGSSAIDKQTGLLVLYRIFELPVDADFFVEAFARLVGAAAPGKEGFFSRIGHFFTDLKKKLFDKASPFPRRSPWSCPTAGASIILRHVLSI